MLGNPVVCNPGRARDDELWYLLPGLNFIEPICLGINVESLGRIRIFASRTKRFITSGDVSCPEVAQVRLDPVDEGGGKAVFREPMFLHRRVWVAGIRRSKTQAVSSSLP